jgi:hypothetical protein
VCVLEREKERENMCECMFEADNFSNEPTVVQTQLTKTKLCARLRC